MNKLHRFTSACIQWAQRNGAILQLQEQDVHIEDQTNQNVVHPVDWQRHQRGGYLMTWLENPRSTNHRTRSLQGYKEHAKYVYAQICRNREAWKEVKNKAAQTSMLHHSFYKVRLCVTWGTHVSSRFMYRYDCWQNSSSLCTYMYLAAVPQGYKQARN